MYEAHSVHRKKLILLFVLIVFSCSMTIARKKTYLPKICSLSHYIPLRGVLSWPFVPVCFDLYFLNPGGTLRFKNSSHLDFPLEALEVLDVGEFFLTEKQQHGVPDVLQQTVEMAVVGPVVAHDHDQGQAAGTQQRPWSRQQPSLSD